MSSQNEDGHKTIFVFRDFSPKIIKSKFPPIGKDMTKLPKGLLMCLVWSDYDILTCFIDQCFPKLTSNNSCNKLLIHETPMYVNILEYPIHNVNAATPGDVTCRWSRGKGL